MRKIVKNITNRTYDNHEYLCHNNLDKMYYIEYNIYVEEYSISSYVDDGGKEPVKDWLKSLDRIARKRILLRFDRLKDENFGDYKQLDEDLYELRFNFGPGYRVYYTFENNTIVLLINGGDKKSQAKDIKKAQDIINELKGK